MPLNLKTILKLFFMAFLFSSCSNFLVKPDQNTLAPGSTWATSLSSEESGQYYLFQCKIIDLAGNLVRQDNANFCAYFDDGRAFVAWQTGMVMLSPDRSILWKKTVNCHHNARAVDSNHVILLNSSFHHFKKQWMRFDRISLYSTDGKEVKYFDYFENLSTFYKIKPELKNSRNYSETLPALQIKQQLSNVEDGKSFEPTFVEFSHANSVYRIEPNSMSARIPAFHEGNYIVNDRGIGLIFILDKDLKKILWSMSRPAGDQLLMALHDVQVLPTGELLYLNNHFEDANSSIEQMDPLTGARNVIFQGGLQRKFFSFTQGSVQLLPNGNYLIAEFGIDQDSEILTVSPEGNIVNSTIIKEAGRTGNKLTGFQEIKMLNLKNFFEHSKKGLF